MWGRFSWCDLLHKSYYSWEKSFEHGRESQVIATGRNYTNEKKNATRHAELEAYDHVL
jgi:hypothetical protein